MSLIGQGRVSIPWRALLVMFGLLVWSVPVYAEEGSDSLQAVIDRAPPGSTVKIAPGTYAGPITLAKPITLFGGPGVRIVNGGGGSEDRPLLLLQTSGANVQGVRLEDKLSLPKHATVEVRGDNNVLSDLTIATAGIGIRLQGADGNKIRGVHIQGTGVGRSGGTVFTVGNGIELWNSNDNRVENCRIAKVQDGVYLDTSRRNQVLNNVVQDSHYAVHLMFTGESDISGNRFARNITGVMVMGDDGSRVIGNHIEKQAANVQAQGILVYDSHHCLIAENHVIGNRIGFYVDQASQNRFVDNTIAQNFLGLYMTASRDNDFNRNLWVGNVVQAQAISSRDNRMAGNYWDDLQGLDADGDGRSDLPYQASPFLLALTRAVPAYQIFFQAPGTFVLEQLFAGDTRRWLTDTAPLMKPPDTATASAPPMDKTVPLVSFFLLGLGLYPFLHHRPGV
ncbi:right-handed parallel beta-helix repeat-containing protein [Kyrpidia tusciae]|uniref:ABC transporter substrate binding protein n=1 Tax=Kyrpidia tusciae (strain DSM 2912 / NBRC 15312 / T2) TaxID=562970 RepID=D5WTW7_KYRT2|nr:NosD domain-containing protein [Kyrpidia tusciae]ADG05287.1 putative ABC transporter substrate binding protein [Kyrpidia tusciae DSM 2912]